MSLPENAVRRTLFSCLFFLLAGAAVAAPKDKIGIPPAKPPVCNAQGKIEQGPKDSAGQDCGIVAGGPCAFLDASYYASHWLQGKDPEAPVFHPNGDFAWNGRCDVDEKGRPMACVAVSKVGTCKVCGEPGKGENPALFTYLGCPPKGKDCPEGLSLWPNGKCYDSNRGLPSWECEADCTHRYANEGWCSQGSAWWGWLKTVNDDAGKLNQTYQKPICAAFTSCTGSGLSCAAQGKACNTQTGKCVTECTTNAQCQAAGYPEGFQCFSGGTCRLKP